MKKLIPENYVVRIILFLLSFVVLYFLLKGLALVINDNYILTILTYMAINTILALGLNLITGITGQLNLGHAAFMSIGAYTGALLTMKMNMPFGFSILFAGLMAALIGVLIGYPILRLTGDYFAIATLGFAEIVRVMFNGLAFTNGAIGISGIPRYTNFSVAWSIAVFVIILMVWINNSRNGRAYQAIRDNEIAAESMGINTALFKVQSFAVGSFLGGVGGALLAHQISFIKPDMFGFMKSIELLMMVVMGGLGSIPGTILGAGLLTIAPEALRIFADYKYLIYGSLLVVMMIFRPNGILGGVNLRQLLDLSTKKKNMVERKNLSN